MCFAAGSGRPQTATFIPPSILLSTGASKTFLDWMAEKHREILEQIDNRFGQLA
mgnify:CR=1 FL=1